MSNPTILLFKERKEGDVVRDPYAKKLRQSGYEQVVFVPLFETVTINMDQVRNLLHSQAEYYNGGLIITSQRAVECLKESHADLSQWKSIYVVGPATANALKESFQNVSVLGEGSGNADALADFILSTIETMSHGKMKFLFLTGDKSRDVIPVRLQQAGCTVNELQVYATRPQSSLLARLDSLRVEFDIENSVSILFSPSSAYLLRDMGVIPGCVISIGPTTSSAIRELGWNLVGESSKPNPDSLVDAINFVFKIAP